jgi:hypothetical protein
MCIIKQRGGGEGVSIYLVAGVVSVVIRLLGPLRCSLPLIDGRVFYPNKRGRVLLVERTCEVETPTAVALRLSRRH